MQRLLLGVRRVDRDGAALRQPIPQLLTWCGGQTHFGSSSSDRVGFRSVYIRRKWAMSRHHGIMYVPPLEHPSRRHQENSGECEQQSAEKETRARAEVRVPDEGQGKYDEVTQARRGSKRSGRYM